MAKIFEDKDYDKAEEIMLDFVGGGTWEESLQCDFSSGEVQELIAKGIKAERAEAQKPNASENTLPIQNVSNSALIDTPLTYCPKCKSTDIRQYTKGTDKCNNCNHAWDIYRPFKGID